MDLNLVWLNVRPDPSNKATFHQWSYPKTANEENTNLNNHAFIIRTAVDIVGCVSQSLMVLWSGSSMNAHMVIFSP